MVRSRPAQSRRVLSAMPRLEALEQRECLSCAASISDHGRTLRILGDNDDNHVTIQEFSSTHTLHVECDGQSYDYDTHQFKKISVDLKGGDDTFHYYLGSSASPDYFFGKMLCVSLGRGNDTAIIDAAFGDGSGYARCRSSLFASIDAGSGDDCVYVNLGPVFNSNVSISTKVGDGQDCYRATLFGDLSGNAKVSLRADGGRGDDQLTVESRFDRSSGDSSGIDLDRQASLSIDLRGGSGNDSLSTSFAGRIDGCLTINEDGGHGDDSVSADVSNDFDGSGKLRVFLAGGWGDDLLRFDFRDYGHLRLRATLDGGAGFDHSQASPNVLVTHCESRQ